MKLKERLEFVKKAVQKSNMSEEAKRWLNYILEEWGKIRSSTIPVTVRNPIGEWE